jgi:hypothetical protein
MVHVHCQSSRKGLEGREAFPKGMERSGTPESPVFGAKRQKCAQKAGIRLLYGAYNKPGGPMTPSKAVFIIAGFVLLALGSTGIALPVLPATPFIMIRPRLKT